MSSYEQDIWFGLQGTIAVLEAEGLVRPTFRRLDLDKQRQIVVAVSEALADRPSGMNIKKAAANAGVSVGSMYQYFPNRDAMVSFIGALTAAYVTASFAAFEPMIARMPLREALAAYLFGGVEWSREQVTFLRLFARSAYCGDETFRQTLVQPVSEAMLRLVTRMLEGALARGELLPEVDPASAARLINGFYIAVGDAVLLPHLNDYLQVFENPSAPEGQMAAAVDFVMRSIAVAPKGGPE